MAKHRKGRRNRSFVAVPVEGQIALGALADATLIKGNLHTGLFTEDFFAISTDLQVSVRALTAGEGMPSSWGVNHSDYSVTEVDENLEVDLLGRGSKIEQEQARRLVRNGAGFESDPIITTTIRSVDGKQRVPLRFMVQEGFAVEIWFKNRSSAAMTTGGILEWHGTIYGRWVT